MAIAVKAFKDNKEEIRTLVYRFPLANGLKHPFNNEAEMTGKEWVRSFLSRHRALSVRVSEGLSGIGNAGLPHSKEVVVEAQDEAEVVSPNQEQACASPASSTSTAGRMVASTSNSRRNSFEELSPIPIRATCNAQTRKEKLANPEY
ncbi:hypothetical protein PR048_007123 [Dryococelus australis]|uniref:HTH CENPB-type domain-containing protein n=1 Tax=Dryococelus australis TaxID=614101 RepID=A0ABQ9ICR3_9NEOP|nr:hypothetical protein PR048_007123 [Dryococelus australis]